MEYLGLIFWVFNALLSFYGIYHWSRLWNPNRVWGLFTPAGWIWMWQALGVGLVPIIERSPWHLLWWFPVGCAVCAFLGRFLRQVGILHF